MLRLSIAVVLMMFMGSAWGEWADRSVPPTLEHIMVVLEESEAKIENVNMLITSQIHGAGLGRTGRAASIKFVYDARGRIYHRYESRGSLTSVYIFDGEKSTRYHPSRHPEKPEEAILMEWSGMHLDQAYIGGELPGDFGHYWGDSLLTLLQKVIKSGDTPTIELVNGKVVLTLNSLSAMHRFLSFRGNTLRLELDPDKSFFVTKEDGFSGETLKREMIITPKEVDEGIWLWDKVYIESFLNGDITPTTKRNYQVTEVNVNVSDLPETIFKLDAEKEALRVENPVTKWSRRTKASTKACTKKPSPGGVTIIINSASPPFDE